MSSTPPTAAANFQLSHMLDAGYEHSHTDSEGAIYITKTLHDSRKSLKRITDNGNTFEILPSAFELSKGEDAHV